MESLLPGLPYFLWLLTTANVLWSIAICGTAAALAYRPLTRRFGWPRWPTALALASFAVIAVITFTPPVNGWLPAGRPHDCLAITRTDLVHAVTHFGRGIQEKLNILMLVPLGFFLTLATRRPARCAAAMLLFPALIEIVQGSFSGRHCSPLDWTDNAAGGLIGVAAALAWLAHRNKAGAR
jgi:VanZ family protein